MKKIQLFYQNELAFFLYYDSRNEKNGLVDILNLNVYFPGLPQYLDQTFFEGLVDQKNAYIQVCYYGSWFSGNKFTYLNCLKSVIQILKIIRHKIAIRTIDGKGLKWNINFLNIIGYSFSGNILLKLIKKLGKFDRLILLAPMAFIEKSDIEKILDKKSIDGFYASNLSYYKFLCRGYKNIYRGIENSEWQSFFQGGLSGSKVALSEGDNQNLLIVQGGQDKIIPNEFYDVLKKKYKTHVVYDERAAHDIAELLSSKKISCYQNKSYKPVYLEGKFEKMLRSFKAGKEFGIFDKREQIEGVVFEINKQKLINKLNRLKAKKILSGIQTIITYDFPNKSLKKNTIVLRTKTINGKTELQYKKLIFDEGRQGRKEKEMYFALKDPRKVDVRLKKMGLVQTGIQQREMISYLTNNIRYNIETWPNTPTYVGIEVKSYAQLDEAARSVGLNEKKIEQIGGVDIFEKYKLKLKNATFNHT